ncbi:YhdP family protein [Pistricoccus aurantiacus]|uniref:YhdP family protein n=1 Tax=Pistricoccus aurantiacus TaxID=1883414 RepID=UPI003628E0D7
MSPFRLLIRWVLTLIAWGLGFLAVLLLLLRLLLADMDHWQPHIEELLSQRFNAQVSIDALRGGVSGVDPAIAMKGFSLVSRGPARQPLLEIQEARLGLDVGASLMAGLPVVDDARAQGITIHLYQQANNSWHWPRPAQIPPTLTPDSRFTLKRLDFWVGALLRQRLVADRVSLVLHGQDQDQDLKLTAPRLLFSGDANRAHIEGELYIADQPSASLTTVIEIQPGSHGLEDFSAALQANMDLGTLGSLTKILTRNQPLRVDRIDGKARLWGRWHEGRLDDARLDLRIPELTANHEDRTLSVQGIHAVGQWQREKSEAWQAWFNLEAEEKIADSSPPLPRYWQAHGQGSEWWLNASEFDLAAMNRWREALPLPSSFEELLTKLSPRGRVSGLGLGYRDDAWRSRIVLRDTLVDPWNQIPGGGPVDAWIETQDGRGEVRFSGRDTRLVIPEIFPEPLRLDAAQGEVDWKLEGKRAKITGKNLQARWRDAPVTGGFKLALGDDEQNAFALDLDFANVDAVTTPLAEWLPTGVLGPELTEWLSQGIAGRVPRGRFSLAMPLVEDLTPEQLDLTLSLDVEDGSLVYAEGWPALEELKGHLDLEGQHLAARVESGESRGLEIRQGSVELENDILGVSASAVGTPVALIDFLAGIPDVELDPKDWQGQGDITGQLDLEMPIADPDALVLSVATRLEAPRLTYQPASLDLEALEGQVTYRYANQQGGLDGKLDAQAFGGPLGANFDVDAQRVILDGKAQAQALLRWADQSAFLPLVNGSLPYTAQVDYANLPPRVALQSDLEGLSIRLPAPFGKRAEDKAPLAVSFETENRQLDATLANRLRLRYRDLDDMAPQGQLWLEDWPQAPRWPTGGGWEVDWQTPRLSIGAWQETLSALGSDGLGDGGASSAAVSALRLSTDCLSLDQRCLGDLDIRAFPQGRGGWRAGLRGSLMEGRFDYRPSQARPLDISLSRLNLGALVSEPSAPDSLLDEVAPAPQPLAYPAGLENLPAGQLNVTSLEYRGQRFGPLSAAWQASSARLELAPVSLRLGQVEASGELTWETAGEAASLTRSRLKLEGGDLGSALAVLGQEVSIRNADTRVDAQLAWPGAPWQFALERSRGSIGVDLRNGRFLNVQSPSAKLVGLLNFDNLLRRLRLDFTDVTGRGTAFDSVKGDATLYGGILETAGPVKIDAVAASITLNGSVDLAKRELDQRLTITLPVSQALPVAALVAGGPIIGGAMFIAERLFGGALDTVSQIHYRVRGPWTEPQISVESAQ